MRTWILVDRSERGVASGIAMGRLKRALDGAQIAYECRSTWTGPLPEHLLIAAVSTDPLVYLILGECAYKPESVRLAARGPIRVVSGSDTRGFAYALMEMAERIEAYGEDALLELKDETVSPSLAVRGIDKFVSNSGDMEWWMDERYWRWYLERMLADRFNRIVLLAGFDTPYLSPPYAFFVDVPEYPGVRLLSDKTNRGEHLAALRRLGRLAHEYGMEFVFATWQQALYIPGQTAMVDGITNLADYCSKGVRELLLQCPEIDMIHFRVNNEAGVGGHGGTAEEFWFSLLDGIAAAKRLGRDVKLDMRAKGLTDAMIAYAKEQDIDLTVSTKYWCEQAGLPYHLTRMRTEELTQLDNLNHSRRYSYADMHKKPRLHKFVYRLWNNGSADLWSWGDPDYIRRFAASMALGRAEGFEVMPPLGLKGGAEDMLYQGWHIFDDPTLREDGYEDARYWLFYRLFGRIGYNLEEDEEAWGRPMRGAFGRAAEPMMNALSAASRLLPLVVASHMPSHPQLYFWAELCTGAALFSENNHNGALKRHGVTYQNTEPSDAGLFYPIDAYVRDRLAGKEDGRYTPAQVMGWFEGIAFSTGKYLDEAAAGLPDTAHARGAVLDLRMLREMALYHRHKMAAAVTLCLHQETEQAGYLAASLAAMQEAREHWAAMAALGTETYHSRLCFTVGNCDFRVGHWNDYLPELDADIARLRQLLGSRAAAAAPYLPAPAAPPPAWSDDTPACCPAGKPLAVSLETAAPETFRGTPVLRFRHTNQMEGRFLSLPMQFSRGAWRAVIPAGYMVPEWDLLVYFEAVSPDGDGMLYPGVWHPEHALPYHIVRVV